MVWGEGGLMHPELELDLDGVLGFFGQGWWFCLRKIEEVGLGEGVFVWVFLDHWCWVVVLV
jgi:hypothetical protein